MKHASLSPADLHAVYLFAGLDDEQLQAMLETAYSIELAPREVLFEAGQPAKHFYLLRSGQIKLFALSDTGDEKVVEIIYPGETFAEAITFMTQHNYPVSAEAITASEVISFDMGVFRRLLEDSRETCMRLMADMSRRLRQRIAEINNLTLHNATYRLVVYLLEQIPPGVVELPEIHLGTPKSVIASRLSIQPETFSRILAKLARQGLIRVHQNNITLLDVEGLRSLL